MGKVEAIGHGTDAFLDLKWPIKLRGKLVGMADGERLLPIGLELEEYPISDQKFPLSSTLIMDLFHPVLSKLKVGP